MREAAEGDLMAVKLSIRLQDALQDLQELRDNMRETHEPRRVREVEMSIRAVDDAIELHKALEQAASPLRELLHHAGE